MPPPPPPTAPLRFVSNKMSAAAPQPSSSSSSSSSSSLAEIDKDKTSTKSDIKCPDEKLSSNAIRASNSAIVAPPERRSAAPLPPPPPPPPSVAPDAESAQQVMQLRKIVQDLTAENTILQQRVKALMEGDNMDDSRIPGLNFARGNGKETLEVEALQLRIRRLEAALKLEAMEREELEVRLQAQERVLVRLVKK